MNSIFKLVHTSCSRMAVVTMCMLLCCAVAYAQTGNSDDEKGGGNVTVQAPSGLLKRSNAEYSKAKKSTSASPSSSKTRSSSKPKLQGGNGQTTEQSHKAESQHDDRVVFEDDDKSEAKEQHATDDDKATKDNASEQRRHGFTHQVVVGRGVGYRIQVYTDNNYRTARVAARNRAREIALRFPQYRSYISYNAPSWRLRIGDFTSSHQAQKALQDVKKAFPAYRHDMLIVRDHINIWSNE